MQTSAVPRISSIDIIRAITIVLIPWWGWYPLCCLCFILIWNNYPRNMNKKVRLAIQVVASLMLLLAWFYRGGEEVNDRFSSSW